MASPASKRRRLSNRHSTLGSPSSHPSLSSPVPNTGATVRLLSKLSKETLGKLALKWLDNEETRPDLKRKGGKRKRGGSEDSEEDDRSDSSDDEDDDDDDTPSERLEKLRIYYADVSSISKPRLIERITHDWRSGLFPSQVADADVASYVEKPASGRSWTAFELVYAAGGGVPKVGMEEVEGRLREALESLFAAPHVQVSKPYDDTSLSPLHIRLSLPSSENALASPTKAAAVPVVHLLHFQHTPYLLLPPLTSSLTPNIHQSLITAFSRPPGRRIGVSGGGVVEKLVELKLKGKDWRGLREMLVEGASGVSSGLWSSYRVAPSQVDPTTTTVPEAEDGETLAPPSRRKLQPDEAEAAGEEYVGKKEEGRIMMDDFGSKTARDKEVFSVFGKKALPKLERIVWQIPTSALLPEVDSTAAEGEEDPTFTIQLDGPSVLEGLRLLVSQGYTEDGEGRAPGLPEWMGEAVGGGENRVELKEVAEGEAGEEMREVGL